MPMKILLFSQPGCLSCELMKVFLEAHEVGFEERDISVDPAARQEMTEKYDSPSTPTLVIISGDSTVVIRGFEPERLEQILIPTPSAGSAVES